MVEETIDLRELWHALYKRKWLIILMVILAAVTALIATAQMPRIYEATTTILVKEPGSSAERLVLEGLQGSGKNQMQNHIELLRSRTIALRAANELGHAWTEYDRQFAAFRRGITVQPVSGTDAIRISVQGEDQSGVAAVANAVAETFIEFNREMNRAEASSARVFIEEQLSVVEAQLRDAEGALQHFREEQRVLYPNEETRILLSTIADLEAQRAQLQLEQSEMQRRLDDFRRSAAAGNTDALVAAGMLQDPLINSHVSTLFSLETELAGLRNQYSNEHPTVRTVLAKIAEVEKQLNQGIERVLGNQISVETVAKMDALGAEIARAEARLTELPERELMLARLIRDQSVAEQIYLLLRNRYEEVRITEAMKSAEVMVIDPSIVPDSPIKPRRTLNLAIAAFLGLFIGVGLALVFEFLDTTVKSAEEVEELLGLPVLGRIPLGED